MSIHENTGPRALDEMTVTGAIASVTSNPFKNRYARRLQLTVKLANKAGTVTYTPIVQFKGADDTWRTLWTAAAALSANGTAIYQLNDIAVSTASGITESKIAALPLDLRVGLTYSGAGAGNSFDTYVEIEEMV